MSVSGVIIFLAAISVAVVGLVLKKLESDEKQRKANDPKHMYAARASLITKREREFLRTLDMVAADLGLRVCPQVRLEDVIRVPKGADNHFSSRNRIKGMHIDFVLVEPTDFSVYACVELQDTTHNTRSRREADAKKAAALKSAGVPLLAFKSPSELQTRGLLVD